MQRNISLPQNNRISPLAIADAYKESHSDQYPAWVTYVYSNMTPRSGKLSGVDRFVFFGLQAFLYKLNATFKKDFFDLEEWQAVHDFRQFHRTFFGADNYSLTARVVALHRLGYLPLRIRALKEGSSVPYRIPVLTIENTLPEFFWLTNFVETWMSSEVWHASTSASTAHHYRKVFDKYADKSSDAAFMPEFQGHDFSFRGMEGLEAAMASGAGHLLSFKGTDTCPALGFIDRYYWGSDPEMMIGTSVPATEHSVISAGGQEGELETFRRLLKIYPTGILSVVSDTWDFWHTVTEILPALKDEIMARDGKLVIRPDSSPKTPVEIICGDYEAKFGSPEHRGLAQCLHRTFGGTQNSHGYIDLDPHIGMIYGDSITKDVQQKILSGLLDLGYSSTNIVLGIGSYSYQYVSRDTHGLAIKATAVGKGWRNGYPEEIIPIFKDPKTDVSGKKSARGLLEVVDDGDYKLLEDCSGATDSFFELVYLDGILTRHMSFEECRAQLTCERALGR